MSKANSGFLMKAAFLILAAGLSSVATAFPENQQATSLKTIRITFGLSKPLFLCAPPGDKQRLFIVEQTGTIKIFKNGALLPNNFLNISGQVSGGNEQGLLGLAFHPNYASNGLFFINYTNLAGNTVIARYHVSLNPDSADPTSGSTTLAIGQPFSNHNGGMLAFGPYDGYLYIGMGDGGSAGDPGNRAQDGTTLLGKILRIDVNVDSTYAIPPSNPFVGSLSTLPEIWAKGVRNPWRFSFDSRNGDLFIADVGQNLWEEIDYQPLASSGGENYGWRLKEGLHCYNPPTGCDTITGLTDPIYEYSHGAGRCSITGGYVYRGCAIPDLQGTYFFADYCTGQIWSFRYDGSGLTEFTDRTVELDPGGVLSIDNITSFGEDGSGELYIVDQTGGEIYKIVPNGIPSSCSIGCGDVNGNGSVNIQDVTFLIGYLYMDGPAPDPVSLADVNFSGLINIQDITYLINFLYKGGPAPNCGPV